MSIPDHITQVQCELLHHADRLKGFLHALTGDRAAADDLFQELFLTITAKAGEFTLGTDFGAWARTIARYKVLAYHARLGHRLRRLDPGTIEALCQDPPPEDDGSEQHREALRACLGRLAPAARHVLHRRYVEGMGPGEIAAVEGRSANAVAVSLAKVLSFLRSCTRRQLATAGT